MNGGRSQGRRLSVNAPVAPPLTIQRLRGARRPAESAKHLCRDFRRRGLDDRQSVTSKLKDPPGSGLIAGSVREVRDQCRGIGAMAARGRASSRLGSSAGRMFRRAPEQ